MPTKRPRHLVTETDELAAALDAAGERHPGTSRPQLLVRLALEGHQQVQVSAQELRRHRRVVATRHAGALTGAWTTEDREHLAGDWPS